MLFIDRADVSRKRVTSDGYMVADARVARVGIQHYAGYEVGKPELQSVAVYRPEEEVFKSDSLSTYAHRPVTIGHPPEGVSAKNWRDVARGAVGGDVMRDGEFVRVPMTIMDQAAIRDVEGGVCEISMGYHCRLEFVDGVSPQGEPYQAVQRDLRMNHAAIVPKGRAGSQCRIGDSWSAFDAGGPRDPGMPSPRNPTPHREITMKTHMIGDNAVEMSDAAIVAVKGLQQQLGTLTADNLKLTADLATLTGEHAKVVETKDGEILKLQADHKVAIEAKDAEIAKLKSEALTADKLEAAVAERKSVMDAALPVLGAAFDAKGKSVADIRRATVAKRLGDKAVEGKTDEHVAIAFDTLTAVAPPPDPVRQALASGATATVQAGDSAGAYEAMKSRLSTQYLPQSA